MASSPEGKMARPGRALTTLLLAVGFFGVASGGLFSQIGIVLSKSGIGEVWIGALSSTYFVGTLAGSATAGPVIAKLGHDRAFGLFALLAAISTAGLAVTGQLEAWFVLRLLTGYAMGAYYLALESWINHLASNDIRGRSLGLYECVRMGAVALGPALLGIGTVNGSVLAAAGCFLLAIVPVALLRGATPDLAPNDKRTRERRLSLRELVAKAPMGPAACFVAGLLSSSFYGLGAVFGERIGLADERIMLFMSATWAAPLVAQIPVGFLADRLGRAVVLPAISATAAASAAAIAILGAWSFAVLLGLSVLVGGLGHPAYALGVGLMNDRLPREEVLRAGATLLIAYSLGTTCGPTAGAAVMSLIGAEGLYVFFAFALSGLAALTTFRLMAGFDRGEASPVAAADRPAVQAVSPKHPGTDGRRP